MLNITQMKAALNFALFQHNTLSSIRFRINIEQVQGNTGINAEYLDYLASKSTVNRKNICRGSFKLLFYKEQFIEKQTVVTKICCSA